MAEKHFFLNIAISFKQMHFPAEKTTTIRYRAGNTILT
jgi:hypothetical protein